MLCLVLAYLRFLFVKKTENHKKSNNYGQKRNNEAYCQEHF